MLLTMAYDAERSRKALQNFIDRTSLKEHPWELASGVGPGTIRAFLKGRSKTLTENTYEKLAAGATKSLGRQVLASELRGPASQSDSTSMSSETTASEPVSPRQQIQPVDLLTGPNDVPVWASAAAGDDGAMVLSDAPIDHIRRSERMLGVKNPFAFYVHGTSMSPAIKNGDQVVINPGLPPRIDDECVFISDDGAGGMLALVKTLVRSTPERWQVKQYDPAKDFALSKGKWSRAYRVSEVRRG